jgi:hypothetical protein
MLLYFFLPVKDEMHSPDLSIALSQKQKGKGRPKGWRKGNYLYITLIQKE